MKNKIVTICLLPLFFLAYAQVGVNTENPQKTLHVNGALQLVNELNVGGSANTAGSAGVVGQVLMSNGPDKAPSWGDVSNNTNATNVTPKSTGTVIVVRGKMRVAQEITVQLGDDFEYIPSVGNKAEAMAIGNLSYVIIDNENSYRGSVKTNSFIVNEEGVYQIMINAQLSVTGDGEENPAIGIWDDTSENWVARVDDYFSVPRGQFQTYTLITSIRLMDGRDYSFRIASKAPTLIKRSSSGSTGVGPITQITVKRLK